MITFENPTLAAGQELPAISLKYRWFRILSKPAGATLQFKTQGPDGLSGWIPVDTLEKFTAHGALKEGMTLTSDTAGIVRFVWSDADVLEREPATGPSMSIGQIEGLYQEGSPLPNGIYPLDMGGRDESGNQAVLRFRSAGYPRSPIAQAGVGAYRINGLSYGDKISGPAGEIGGWTDFFNYYHGSFEGILDIGGDNNGGGTYTLAFYASDHNDYSFPPTFPIAPATLNTQFQRSNSIYGSPAVTLWSITGLAAGTYYISINPNLPAVSGPSVYSKNIFLPVVWKWGLTFSQFNQNNLSVGFTGFVCSRG